MFKLTNFILAFVEIWLTILGKDFLPTILISCAFQYKPMLVCTFVGKN